MVNPKGIVAMLVLLLSSGTALADNHIPIHGIADIKVTNTNKIFFEMRNGNTIEGLLPNCNIEKYISKISNPITGLGLYAHGKRYVKDSGIITFLNLEERKLSRRSLGSCEVRLA
jgi:hypothetical protein